MSTLEERMNIIACRLRASNYSEDYIDAYLIGYAEGRAEGIIATARKLKELGVSMEMIMQSTNLSAEEIEKL